MVIKISANFAGRSARTVPRHGDRQLILTTPHFSHPHCCPYVLSGSRNFSKALVCSSVHPGATDTPLPALINLLLSDTIGLPRCPIPAVTSVTTMLPQAQECNYPGRPARGRDRFAYAISGASVTEIRIDIHDANPPTSNQSN